MPCRLSHDLYSRRLNAPIVSCFTITTITTICICRRARSERQSRIKAMQAREKKGVCKPQQCYNLFLHWVQLLSEEEKVILATEMAVIDKQECVIM